MEDIKIAVIGLGPAGLTALKCLRDEGFDAIAFERRDEVGGVWSHSPDESYTSVIQGTVSNISKFIVSPTSILVSSYVGSQCMYDSLTREAQSLASATFQSQRVSKSPSCLTLHIYLPTLMETSNEKKDYPPYLTGSQMAEYMQAYARNFDLEKHMRFNTTVHRVTRDPCRDAWRVRLVGPTGEEEEGLFHKVVFGTGSERFPVWPLMPGRDAFRGIVMHGQSYKSPEPFIGKRVLVVGIGNTACDVSTSLVNKASHVHQSYRRGRVLVSRYLDNGLPLDSTIPWSGLQLKYLLDKKVPWLTRRLVDKVVKRKMVDDASRQEDPSSGGRRLRRRMARKRLVDWNLMNGPSVAHGHPAVQEDFVSALYAGQVEPVAGFKAFVGPDSVLLEDGSVVVVDVVIFCTGYQHGFGIMPELEMDGCCGLPLVTAGEDKIIDNDTDRKRQPQLPRLYQMIFPPRNASSIAFLSYMAPQESAWTVCELASIAISQIWAAETTRPHRRGSISPSLLPAEAEMEKEATLYHKWWRGEWKREPSMRQGFVRGHDFYRFLHRMAGTDIYRHLDHVLSGVGWKLWWCDRELYRWIASGPMCSYAWRLFDSNPDRIPGCGRAAWPGARKAVEEAYEAYNSYKAAVLSNKSLAFRPRSSSTLGNSTVKPVDSGTV
ncbi:hypothetical protein CP532_2330 [Ophiocordyceps camponoti-leonardi (nom. inval.)]|nr:hypothetical protein CP532_2330 [Ophiocordyceps camponoti-leonardi (nom. inval.)]